MDPVVSAITKAKRAVGAALAASRNDLRTTDPGLECCFTGALTELQRAQEWMSGLIREEAANNKPEKAPAPPKPTVKTCAGCDAEVDDPALCSGCNGWFCESCMGADGYCQGCEEDDD